MILPEAKERPEDFHTSFEFPIKLLKSFGFFPMFKKFKFNIGLLTILYSCLTFLMFISMLVIHTIYIANNGFNSIFKTSELVFCVGSVLNWLCFLKLALDWEVIEREWHKLEVNIKQYEIPNDLSCTIKKITIIFMTIAFIEHCFFLSVGYLQTSPTDPSFSNCLQEFFLNAYSDWFQITEYSLWKGILLEICDIQRTFIWTFADVFIISLSVALNTKLKQITAKIRTLISAKVSDFHVWKTIREDYTKIYDLNQLINEKMSWLIFFSFVLNLYFILIQLFSTLKPMKGTVRKTYFYVSFWLIIIRVVCVCLYCGQVHENARDLVTVLNQLPSNIYNLEIDRLHSFLTTLDMVFSVRDYFKITKKLILKIAGAIVAYELILIQLYGDEF